MAMAKVAVLPQIKLPSERPFEVREVEIPPSQRARCGVGGRTQPANWAGDSLRGNHYGSATAFSAAISAKMETQVGI